MEDITRFSILTEQVLSQDEKRITGIGEQIKNRRELDESIVGYKIGPVEEFKQEIEEQDSDGDIIFKFEDQEEAVDMYSFFIESRLLEPGEIVLRNVEEEYTVSFAPSIIINKPEMIQAALLAYEDRLYADTDEDINAFESVIEDITNSLSEASGTRTSGAPKRKKGMGNPFHDRDDGKFSGAENHASKGGGSWAIGKRKLKFTGKGKNKDGGLLVKYGSTKHPCGRAAREKGLDIRCWDGKGGGGARVAKIMKGKKRAKEDINVADLSFLMEMRARYGTL
jgi:hypothetical protein